MKKMSFFKRLNAKLALTLIAAAGIVMVGCEKENFDVTTQIQGSTETKTTEIEIPQNDAKVVVSVFVEGENGTLTDANIYVNGQLSETTMWTYSGESVGEMTFTFMVEATGYLSQTKVLKTPAAKKGETFYIPVYIYLNRVDVQETEVEPVDDPEAHGLPEDEGTEEDKVPAANQQSIIEKSQAAGEVLKNEPITVAVPTGNKVDTETIEKVTELLNQLTYENTTVDYATLIQTKSVLAAARSTEDEILKEAKDKILAYLNSKADFGYREFQTTADIPVNIIGLNVKWEILWEQIYQDVSVKAGNKKFTVKNVPFQEIQSLKIAVIAETTTGEQEIGSHHGGGTAE